MATYTPSKENNTLSTMPKDGSMDGSNPQDPALEVEAKTGFFSSRSRRLLWALQFALTVIIVSVPLMVPMILFSGDRVLDDDDTLEKRQYRQLVFYLFSWLLASWLGGCVSYAFALAFPYLFRFVARYVNPAHQRYWRVMRIMKRPITLVGLIIASYISFGRVRCLSVTGHIAVQLTKRMALAYQLE
jgi:hypothetical protein